MARIAWRDITGRAPVEERTLRDVSDLADDCIRVAAEAAANHLAPVFGTALDEATRCR